MAFFAWLEASGLAEWVRMSTEGYPTVITLHAIGMAIMVGLCVIVDLRLLGRFDGIPYESMQRLLPVAWVGFLINTFVSTPGPAITGTLIMLAGVPVYFWWKSRG